MSYALDESARWSIYDPTTDSSPIGADALIPDDWLFRLEQTAPTLTDKIAENRTVGESWIDTAQRLITFLVTTEQQREVLQLQLERARMGQAPLDPATLQPGGSETAMKYGLIIAVLAAGTFLLARR